MNHNEAAVWAQFFSVHPELGLGGRPVLEAYLTEWDLDVMAENLELALLATEQAAH